jgi:tetratricopeptide (TPR) repeat protein
MKSTGWIAVAGWLIASPVFAQSLNSLPAPTASEETSEVSVAPQPNDVKSFDSELERLRQEIAAIKLLREQVASEANQPLTSDVAAAQEQRRELLELLTKLATKNVSAKPASEPPKPRKVSPAPEPRVGAAKVEAKLDKATDHPLITDKIVDPFALGRALFRAEDYSGAEQAFRKVKVTDDNRAMLQYLIATCLRKQSRWEQAAKAYRIVSENKEDPVLRDLALWQLENIRWYQQTESQLKQLRELREPTASPKAAFQDAKATASPR